MAPRRSMPLIVAAVVAAALTLAACGSGTPNGSSSPTPPSQSSGSPESPLTVSQDASSEPSPTTTPDTVSQSGANPGSSGATTQSTSPASTAQSAAALPADCTPAKMQTKKANTLTIATDEPVYPPWFVDDKPQNGQGFEGAVAYAVAAKLGYSKDQVTWVRAHFDAVISPAPKDFDFDINEFSITADRAKVVDFSSGYYDVTQAVVTVKGSKIAGAKSIADLKDADLGAQIGTTSLDAIDQVIKPTSRPAVFQTNDAAVQALKNHQIDGIVTDLPTAFYMTGAQLDNGVLVGQLPATGAKPEQFGLLLEQGSPITSCASAAVDALRADGTLKQLADKWLAQAGAPELN